MDRRKKLLLNTMSGLMYQVVTVICGFILPRLFLEYYGSEVNGLVSSITQFLGFITLAECGVGAVVQSTLYKPLAKKNDEEISKIIISSERFFRTIGCILFFYVIVLCLVFPKVVGTSFDRWFTVSLILSISISLFAQYFLSMSYKLLICADQMGFITMFLQSITVLLNTIVSVVLMKKGVSVQGVKLVTSLIFLNQPIAYVLYVKKHYKINKKLKLTEEPIAQKWNGLAQHIASVVLSNTDVMVLSLFSSLTNVSIYQIYHLIVNGVRMIIDASLTGVQALLGNMYAKREITTLNTTFSTMEWGLHTIITFLFSCTGVLIVPFVQVYTNGVADVNYTKPLFAFFITMAQAAYCLRLPYNIMVLAAGHYKQTQASAIIEMLINIAISIFFVFKFGLVGVAVGTLVAMIYRTVYLAYYLSKNIIFRSIKHFVKHICVDAITGGLILILSSGLSLEHITYFSWIIMAIKTAFLSSGVVLCVNLIFYKSLIREMVKKYVRKID